MKITKEWLRKFKGKMWNKEQIEAIGMTYPLPKRWMDIVEGREINEVQKGAFENSKTVMQKLLIQDDIDYSVYYTFPDGKGSWNGRYLKRDEIGTFPEK